MTQPHAPASPPEDGMSKLMEGPSGPLALAGLILGSAAALLAFYRLGEHGVMARTVDSATPPSLLAVNLSFFAMLLGIAALYRVRKMKGVWLTRTMAIAATVLGLIGPPLYAQQALRWRVEIQTAELKNLEQIATAAKAYADAHEGHFPEHLAVLVAAGKLDAGALHSPFAGTPPLVLKNQAGSADWRDLAAAVDAASDYVYTGKDVSGLLGEAASQIIVVHAKEPRMRAYLPAGFADGSAMQITREQVNEVFKANDEARQRLGLPLMLPPVTDKEPSTRPAPSL